MFLLPNSLPLVTERLILSLAERTGLHGHFSPLPMQLKTALTVA